MKINKICKTERLQEGQFYFAYINSFSSFEGLFSQRLFFSAIEFRQIRIKIWFYRRWSNYSVLNR